MTDDIKKKLNKLSKYLTTQTNYFQTLTDGYGAVNDKDVISAIKSNVTDGYMVSEVLEDCNTVWRHLKKIGKRA